MTATPPSLPQTAPRTSGLAIASLVCGILGFMTMGLSGLPAVILGHIGLSQVRKSGGSLGGGGLAIAGLVMGYVSFLILFIAVLAGLAVPMIMRQKNLSEQTMMISNMRQIGLAMMEFDSEFGQYPSDTTAPVVAAKQNVAPADLAGNRVLQQLEVSGYLAAGSDAFKVPARHKGDWIYFPGRSSKEDGKKPLLVWEDANRRTLVLAVDGSVRHIPVAEGAALLAANPGGVRIPAVRK